MITVTRMENSIRNVYKGNPNVDFLVSSAMKIATDYCNTYEAWSDARLAQSNANKSLCQSANYLKELAANTKAAENLMFQNRDSLKQEISDIYFQDKNISYYTLMNKLNEFTTFGNPAVDSIALPLVHNSARSNYQGLELEPLLKYFKEIADNPAKYTYNLFFRNCATVMREALKLSVKNSSNHELQHAFDLPWYKRILPSSPAMIMQLAATALAVPELIEAERIKIQKLPCVHKRSNNHSTQLRPREITALTSAIAPTLSFSSTTANKEADLEQNAGYKPRRNCM